MELGEIAGVVNASAGRTPAALSHASGYHFRSREVNTPFWIKYLKAGHELAIVDKELTYYRQSPGQGSAVWRQRLLIPDFYRVMDDLVIPTVNPGSKYLTVYREKKAKLRNT